MTVKKLLVKEIDFKIQNHAFSRASPPTTVQQSPANIEQSSMLEWQLGDWFVREGHVCFTGALDELAG